jgi:hypothetical protein
MTYTEMLTDSGLYLFFFSFGLVSGMFIFWVDTRAGKNQ